MLELKRDLKPKKKKKGIALKNEKVTGVCI